MALDSQPTIGACAKHTTITYHSSSFDFARPETTKRRNKKKEQIFFKFSSNISFNDPSRIIHPLIAQMVEHETVDLVVACSSHARRNFLFRGRFLISHLAVNQVKMNRFIRDFYCSSSFSLCFSSSCRFEEPPPPPLVLTGENLSNIGTQ